MNFQEGKTGRIIENDGGTDLAISIWTYMGWRVCNIGNNKGY